ncbi:MAG: glycosyltransferase, partial [Bdellovibrionales bacterium]|nr:glycosyltransferase [Bdellovibrionales bacterium]
SLPHRPSGYGYRSHYLLKTQRALGLSPCASTRPGFPADYGIREFNDVDERDGVSYHRLKLHGDPSYNRWPLDQYLRIYAERLYGLAVKQQPQILHAASNFKNGFVAKSVSEALNIPWVYELRGLWEDTQVSKGIINTQTERYKFMRNVETFCLKSSHAIVTISETLRNEIVQRGVKAEKVFVVPNAVELDSFRPLERDQDLAQALKLGDGPVLGYVSSLVAYEGIEILVRGFAELLKSEPSARLLIVGDGEEYVRLQQLVTKLGIQNAAILTGRVPHSDVRKYYSLIDIFVVPRLPLRVCEIVTPLKPYEAMAMKKAVVVSDVAALKEMVQTDHTGLTFKAGDPSDLARVCLELCQQPDRRKDLGENAARWVKNYRTWESVVSNYFPAYAYALEKFGDPVSAQSYRVPFEQKVA